MKPDFRVLYAEDNAMDAELTCTHLAESAPDLQVEVVETGQACLDRIPQGGYDVLLLDHRLPDMDGLDVLRTLVHGGPTASTPVVLITGSGDEDLVVKALRLGAADYVPKVADYLETLPDVLRGAIERHRSNLARGLLDDSRRRVLYVEHNAMDVDLTRRHFAEVAPQVDLHVSPTCDDALTRLGQPPGYDAVLIDLRMPGKSGLDFVREVKRRGLPMPPFIMLSGKGDEGAAIASLALGAADYVSKREGYRDRLPYVIDRAIAYARLDGLSERLRTELAERERAEEALTFSNAVLSTQQETSTDGILVVDADGQILSANQRFADMWGVPEEILGARSDGRVLQWALDQVEDPDAFLVGVQRLYADPEAKSHDEIALKDGRRFDRYSAPMTGRDGRRFGRVWYFTDVTARMRAEAERRKLEEQLHLAQKMEAVGRLAGGVAHDFNNVLTVILTVTELALQDVAEDSPVRNDLLDVQRAGMRAAALTRQLLAFSRKQVMQPEPMDLNDTILGVEKMLRRVLGEDIVWVTELAPDLGRIVADPAQIEQVLMNLIVNARDAMPRGGRLTISTSTIDVDREFTAQHVSLEPGPHIQLEVSDTGTGMAEETRARIFEPFFTTKEQGRGTGLGLSTVYGIIQQSGGDIWVYSEPGQGTTFKVYLPCNRRGAGSTADFMKRPAPSVATGTETILVVEDEEALRRNTLRVLEPAGYTLLAAADGEEAIEICERHEGEIHLLLTDVVMPKMGGHTLARELVRTRPGLKVLYMSGYRDDAIVPQDLAGAGTQFLAKPFTGADLTRKVREVLNGGATGE